MRRIIFWSLLTIGLVGMLLSVGGFAQQATQPTKIEVWVWSAIDAQHMKTLAATFNTAYPDYQVDIVGKKATEYNTILINALQGGAGPAVFLTRINPMPEQFAKAGLVEALDNIVPLLAHYDRSSLAALSYQGKVYGLSLIHI